MDNFTIIISDADRKLYIAALYLLRPGAMTPEVQEEVDMHIGMLSDLTTETVNDFTS